MTQNSMSDSEYLLRGMASLYALLNPQSFLYTPSPSGRGGGGGTGDARHGRVTRGTFANGGLLLTAYVATQIFPRRQAALQTLTTRTPSHVGGGRGKESKNSMSEANSL